MKPHFKYTLDINMRARKDLICAGGIVELSFPPNEYALRLSSAAYGAVWRFRTEALPEDLKAR
jgi:lipoxygenase